MGRLRNLKSCSRPRKLNTSKNSRHWKIFSSLSSAKRRTNKMKHTGVLTGRLMKNIMRSPDTIITVAITPIAMMLMFVYVFGGAVKKSMPADVNYVNYQLPGILLMAIASGIAYTAYRLFMDVQKGMFPRFNSMPIGRSSMLWSHVLTSLVSNMITVVIIIIVALIMGFRSSAGILNWLAAVGIL